MTLHNNLLENKKKLSKMHFTNPRHNKRKGKKNKLHFDERESV